jgi:hypothetical protein
MERRLSRWAPLTGAVAGILFVIAFFNGGNTPNANASPASVISFFVKNGSAATTSALIGTFAVIFFVFFAVTLAGRTRVGGWLANGVVAGAVFGAVGIAALFAIQYVLGQNSGYLTLGSASALNLLDNSFFLPAAAGMCVFGIVGGLAVVISRAPARWMGWLLMVIGACCASPLLFFAILVAAAWMLAAGIWLTVQAQPKVRAQEPEATLAHV